MNKEQETLTRICITGGIACGKSLVGSVLTGFDIPLQDADDICHKLIKSGTDLFNRIVSDFGKSIIGPDGEINRHTLGKIIFSDAKKRKQLNSLVHPCAERALNEWISICSTQSMSSELKKRGTRAIAAVIPLIYEKGWADSWDYVICVAAPMTIQIARLKNRGLSEQEALIRINAQMPVEEKMDLADYVIFNTGNIKNTRAQTVKLFDYIINQMEKKYERKE